MNTTTKPILETLQIIFEELDISLTIKEEEQASDIIETYKEISYDAFDAARCIVENLEIPLSIIKLKHALVRHGLFKS